MWTPQPGSIGKRRVEWLFNEVRKPALHFKEETGEPVPHPSGTNTAGIHLTYSSENATRAADLLLQILMRAVESPSMKRPKVVKWAADFRATVEALVERCAGNGDSETR